MPPSDGENLLDDADNSSFRVVTVIIVLLAMVECLEHIVRL